MAYVSLYRKYRPQNFEDVVGQDHITRTLKNAIQEGRIASGYLFCGTRGTAKTTCARILAKALNCIGPDGTRTTPTPEPCGVCGPCQSIAASSFVDVVEMDAASHGKVENVRDIVNAVKFQPMEGRYKVYIVDEAHQLSRDAMDAFLKTLEEPPDRVLFVLATTDAEKLPITIASRCQVFEFKRGSVAQISARLTEVLHAEGVTAAAAAITLVARAADGSYRDSLSLLEQVLAYKRENITAADVAIVLGTVDEDLLARVVGLIADADAAGVFTLAGNLLESGKDVRQFLKSLSGRFRDMLFVGVGAQPESTGEMGDSATLASQAARFAPAALLHALEVLTEAEREMRTNTQHRLLLEMALLRLMRLPAAPPHAVSVPAAAVIAAPPAVPKPAPEPAPMLRPVPLKPSLDIPPPLSDDLLMEEEEDEEPAESLIVTTEDELGLTSDLDTDDAEEEDSLLLVQQVAAPTPVAPTPANGASRRPAPPPAAGEPEDAASELVAHLHRVWQEVINRVSSIRPAAVSLTKDGHATALVGKTFTLEFSNRFFVDRLMTHEAGRRMIEDQINRALNVPEGTYQIRGVLRGETSHAGAASGRSTPRPAPSASHVREAPAPPPQSAFEILTDTVRAEFGGQIEDENPRG